MGFKLRRHSLRISDSEYTITTDVLHLADQVEGIFIARVLESFPKLKRS